MSYLQLVRCLPPRCTRKRELLFLSEVMVQGGEQCGAFNYHTVHPNISLQLFCNVRESNILCLLTNGATFL